MNAQRLIDTLLEGQNVSFEHELAIDLAGQAFNVALNVNVALELEGLGHFEQWGHRQQDPGQLNVASMSYQVLQVEDATGQEVELTPELSKAVENAFETEHDTLAMKAQELAD